MKQWLLIVIFALLVMVLVSALTIQAKEDYSACAVKPHKVMHAYKDWEREVLYPTTGRFVMESHYVTNNDLFPNGRLFAVRGDENIEKHLNSACLLLQSANLPCYKYINSWEQVWTPAESGHIGQGARGSLQTRALSPWDEMWMGTQMWATGEMPEPGTKYLLQANGRSVVVQFGWERGPSSQKYLGGLTVETHKYLKTNSNALIKIGLLADQNILTGPINCD
jgi:hypothetical protein